MKKNIYFFYSARFGNREETFAREVFIFSLSSVHSRREIFEESFIVPCAQDWQKQNSIFGDDSFFCELGNCARRDIQLGDLFFLPFPLMMCAGARALRGGRRGGRFRKYFFVS